MTNSKSDEENDHNKLHRLMEEMIYPAVLGAAIYVFMEYVFAVPLREWATTRLNDIRFYWGIWLLTYFCTAFVVLSSPPVGSYGRRTFVLDICEVVAIFFAFHALNLTHQECDSWPTLYWAIAAIPILAFCSKVGTGRRIYWKPSIGACVIAVLMASYFHSCACANVVALVLMCGALIEYFREMTCPLKSVQAL